MTVARPIRTGRGLKPLVNALRNLVGRGRPALPDRGPAVTLASGVTDSGDGWSGSAAAAVVGTTGADSAA
jgi:hypothetical protein